jgi:hypothetical protein
MMKRALFLAMMEFFRLPAHDVAKLLHPGEYQQLKWRAVVHKMQKDRTPAGLVVRATRITNERNTNTVIGYAAPAVQ